MKLVSRRIWKGGPSAVLYWKNSAEEVAGASVVFVSCESLFFLGGARSLSFNRGSLALIIRFMAANFRVLRARPIFYEPAIKENSNYLQD